MGPSLPRTKRAGQIVTRTKGGWTKHQGTLTSWAVSVDEKGTASVEAVKAPLAREQLFQRKLAQQTAFLSAMNLQETSSHAAYIMSYMQLASALQAACIQLSGFTRREMMNLYAGRLPR